MKKITLLFTLLISALSFSQTYAIYTEDSSIGAGLTALRFSNGQGYSAPGSVVEVTTAPYEGVENYKLTYNNTNSYLHAIFIARNATNTGDITIDFSAYSYYNIALKSLSDAPFYIRFKGNNVTTKVLINPASNSYGYTNDGNWHLLSIPFTDFIAESAAFSLTTVGEVFVLRSNAAATMVGGVNDDYEVDNIYLSTTQVLSDKDFKLAGLSMYPNPASNELKIKSVNTIDNVSIYSILGKKVLEISPKNNLSTINISSLKSGLYLVNVESNGKSVVSKLVKN